MPPPIAPAVLCVFDGWGSREESEGNAIVQATTPAFDRLLAEWPHTTLKADGLEVGLPAGQQGNSEVGHLTIGAGRVVLQDLTRIDTAIADGTFYQNPVLLQAVELVLERGSRLHCLGLVSDGGVHSSQSHLVALCRLAKRRGLDRVMIHAFTDGRDTPPMSGSGYLRALLGDLEEAGTGRVVSIGGRYFAMDRDRRWERVEQELTTILGRPLQRHEDAVAYLEESYRNGVGDEFLAPAAICAAGEEPVGLGDGDVVVHFNFRPDRGRELCHALTDSYFSFFDRGEVPQQLSLVTFTQFDETLPAEVAFPKPLVTHTLAEVLSRLGVKQFHIAETEKYAHVTYFINGGREEPFPGEERLMIPSLKVATYDLAPEMSADAICDQLVSHLSDGGFGLLVANFANADMVGHTGDLAATIRAVEVLDSCLGRIVEAAQRAGYLLVMTADHGNAELKLDPLTGAKLTSHTNSPVPLVLAFDRRVEELRPGGALSDVAPTLLAAMGVPIPPEMTGRDLRQVG